MLITNQDLSEAVETLRQWRTEGREHFRSYFSADSLCCESCEADGGTTTYPIPGENELARVKTLGLPSELADTGGLPPAVVAVAAAIADDHPARVVTGPLQPTVLGRR